ncbi:procathepsin L-like isoform X1 [Choristoneura fumiferana]|uniref:procathepsin L-like isoform X1 n=1 Tax=Choristoneura fumiferana TaxID=7141 RepID=UPI003D15E1D1
MSVNSILAVLFLCFRLFTAFLIKDEREFKGAPFVLPEYREGVARDNQTLANYGDVPLSFNWAKCGGVTPVKDQNQCGACWAFSAVAAIESQWKIHTKRDIILSEQFLIDCNDLDAGCDSGSLLKIYGDITSVITGVLEVGKYRPYDETRRKCEWDGDTGALVPVTGFRRVEPGNEVDMVTYLYHNGPISAAINDATMVNYNFYKNPLDRPTPRSCPNDVGSLNHAVLIVGYDIYTDDDGTRVPYWIIKNSWGTDWGHGGYYYLERGTNACGIANDVVFPFVP